jgi:hypothetical protein
MLNLVHIAGLKALLTLSYFAAIGYNGSDPYNIYFEDKFTYFRIGLGMGYFVAPGTLGSKF